MSKGILVSKSWLWSVALAALNVYVNGAEPPVSPIQALPVNPYASPAGPPIPFGLIYRIHRSQRAAEDRCDCPRRLNCPCDGKPCQCEWVRQTGWSFGLTVPVVPAPGYYYPPPGPPAYYYAPAPTAGFGVAFGSGGWYPRGHGHRR